MLSPSTPPISTALLAAAHDLLTLGRLPAGANVSEAITRAAQARGDHGETIAAARLCFDLRALFLEGEDAKDALLQAWRASRLAVAS